MEHGIKFTFCVQSHNIALSWKIKYLWGGGVMSDSEYEDIF